MKRVNHPYRNRHRLHHTDDYFIEYMNGTRYSAQWMLDVEHGNDWYDPHWREEIPRTKWNIFWYRYFGKLPWLSWNKFITSGIILGIPGWLILKTISIFRHEDHSLQAKKWNKLQKASPQYS